MKGTSNIYLLGYRYEYIALDSALSVALNGNMQISSEIEKPQACSIQYIISYNESMVSFLHLSTSFEIS